MPTPAYNFASLPHVSSRHPLWDEPSLAAQLARGEGYLADPVSGRRETLTVDASTGDPEHHVVYPTNTYLPITLAAVTGLFFLSILLKVYWFAPLAVAGVAALAWRWVWVMGWKADMGDQPIGRGLLRANVAEVDRSPGWWGSLFLLVANATLFGSLLFGYAFLWTVAPGWPPPVFVEPSWTVLVLVLAAAILAVTGSLMSIRNNQRGKAPVGGLLIALAGAGGLAVALILFLLAAPPATEHAYGATLLVLGSYGIVHAAVVVLMLAFLLARYKAGYISPRRRAELAIAPLWAAYMSAAVVLVLLAAYLPSLAV